MLFVCFALVLSSFDLIFSFISFSLFLPLSTYQLHYMPLSLEVSHTTSAPGLSAAAECGCAKLSLHGSNGLQKWQPAGLGVHWDSCHTAGFQGVAQGCRPQQAVGTVGGHGCTQRRYHQRDNKTEADVRAWLWWCSCRGLMLVVLWLLSSGLEV